MSVSKAQRNASCPKCGAKNKRCKCAPSTHQPPYKRLWIWISVVAVFVAVILWPLKTSQPTQATLQLIPIVDQYIKEHTAPEVWWYESATPETLPAIQRETLKKRQEILSMLKEYRNLNDFSREIAGYYESARVSVLTQGASLQVGNDKDLTAGPEICFFSKNDAGHQPSSLWFNPNWPALMMSAQERPSKVMPGLTLHEMGHGYAHSLGQASATAPPDSDLFVGEEVTMHELESAAFNHASNGQFFRLIDTILRRNKQSGWKEAMSSIALEDFRQLDNALELKSASASTVNTVSSQFTLAVGLRCIDMHQGGSKQEKLAAYRFITSLLK